MSFNDICDQIDVIPPHFTINLDMSPRERWQHVVKDREQVLQKLSRDFQTILRQQFNETVGKLHKPLLRPLCYMKPLQKTYAEELAGIATLTNKYGLSYGDLVLLNTALDYLTKCTSLVASTTEGQIHGRTLDWDIPLLKQLTIMVTFKKNGSVLYKGVTFVGCVGLLTGLRGGQFSISYNFRKPLQREWRLFCNAWKCYMNRMNISFLLRNVVATCETYEKAFRKIEDEYGPSLATSGYVILGGVRIWQGAIFAVGKESYKEVQTSKVLVQTNHDVSMEKAGGKVNNEWAKDDPILLSTMERKTSVKQALSGLSTINRAQVEDVLRRPPVTNAMTIFRCVMKPVDGELYCVIG